MVESLIDFVAQARGPALVGLVFVLAFGEAALFLDLVVPGEVGVVVAGAAAASNGTSLSWVITAAAVGAFAGDSTGFALGRRFGAGLVDRWGWSRRRLGPALARAVEHYERRGGRSVAVARWIGALRAVVPVVAGSAGLSTTSFVLWDLPSAILWGAVIASVGFVWGDDVAAAVDRVGLGVSVVAVAVIAFVLWRARTRRPPADDA